MSNKVTVCGIDTSTLPKISNEKMLEILKETKQGNEAARENCIFFNMRLVLSIVQRFNIPCNAVDDVFQVGMIGLIKSIDNFDTSLGVQFSTYAVPMIIGEIRRFLRDRTSIKVTRSLRDIAYRALQAKEEIEKQSNIEASVIDVAKMIDEKPYIVSDALCSIMDPISIYENVYSDGEDSLQLFDQIKDQKCTEENWIESTTLVDGINELPSREKDILNLRYFVGKTQTEISNEIGISQAQVSRLEKDAIKHIKSYLAK